MKKALILILGFAAAGSQFASATTVGFSPVPSARTLIGSSGAILGTTSLIWVGNFTSEAFTFSQSLSITANVAAITLAGNWAQFSLDTAAGTTDSGVTSSLAINGSGRLSGSLSDPNAGATKADYFNGKSLYVWAFNAPTVGAATQMGIFRCIDATPISWNFPINGGISQNQTYSVNPSAAPTMVAIGGTGNASTTQMQLVASTVPEPSALALGGLAALGMFASRKRGLKK